MADEHHEKGGEADGGHGHKGGGHGGGAHGGGGGHEEAHEGAPEWLISFADNTALMMGFFVILLAMNMAPKGGSTSEGNSKAAKESGQTAEQLDWALGVREAFHNPVNAFSEDPRDKYLAMRLREKQSKTRTGAIPGDSEKSQSLKPSGYSAPTAVLKFKTHSDTLDASMTKTLAAVAAELRGKRLMVEVRGHVSGLEVSDDEGHVERLSFERALRVVQELIRLGVDRRQLRIVACGDLERTARRVYSADGQHVNERVEIVITDEVMP